jgi:dipeptidyl aminopeptidase/acylaminoacyl peptidase
MTTLLHSAARAASLLILFAWSFMLNANPAAKPPVPLADFFRLPAIDTASMSPNGKYIAATIKGGPQGRLALVAFQTTDLSKVTPLALFADSDVVQPRWVNDDRLVFSVVDFQSIAGEPRAPGLFAVDRDGKTPPRSLVRRAFATEEVYGVVSSRGSRISEPGLSQNHQLLRTLKDGSNDVILVRSDYNDEGEYSGSALVRLDTTTGVAKVISQGAPGGAVRWLVDAKGQPRAMLAQRDRKSLLYWRALDGSSWRALAQWNSFGEERSVWFPLGVDDVNRLYAVARVAGESDTEVLQRLDAESPDARWQQILSLKGFDYYGDLRTGAGDTVLGFDYLTDADGTHWQDERMRRVQSEVDAALPGMINHISCGLCAGNDAVLVKSWSDLQPAVYRVYGPDEKRMRVIAASRPWIQPSTMGQKRMHRVSARDGLSLPVYVTRPASGGGSLPAIVLVHGGPYVRGGTWNWDPHAQLLASRGYLVIEPEFRGSTGFGFNHFRAGWKQWGLTMQDDLADAAAWAVKEGLADANRICIAGASYGGYAAMMGLIRQGDLYRCAINWAGVTDIDLLYTARWSDLSAVWKDYGMPVLIGDRDKDAAQISATSPLKQAGRINRPVLLAYGGEDRRVPIIHGISLRKAIAKHNKDIEWIEYPDEGHGWRLEATQVDFWGRVERFLERHLKPAAP